MSKRAANLYHCALNSNPQSERDYELIATGVDGNEILTAEINYVVVTPIEYTIGSLPAEDFRVSSIRVVVHSSNAG